MRYWLLVMLLCLGMVSAQPAAAQSLEPPAIKAIPTLRLQGSFYLDIATMAQLLSLGMEVEGDSLRLRGAGTLLSLESGSPDVFFRQGSAQESVSLAAPIQRNHGKWYAPPELFVLYDVALVNASLRFPDGSSYPLSPLGNSGSTIQAGRASIVELGNSVSGLAFYSALDSESDMLSLMLVDIGLIALADPGQQQAIDSFMAGIRDGRPLYMIVTSLAPTAWEHTLTFTQGTEEFVARYPLAISVLSGDEAQVSPGQPVIGVVVLPQHFNLREPMTVGWQGIAQRMTFR